MNADPTARKPIPPLSPTKQLILHLAPQVARLHDSEPEALDLIAEARTYLAAPDGPTDAELHDLWLELYRFHDGATSSEVATIARAVLARWGNR